VGCIKLFTGDMKLVKKIAGVKFVSSKKQGLDLAQNIMAKSTLDGTVRFVEMHNKRKLVVLKIKPVQVSKDENMILEPAEEL
jgi:hypothetical protein